VNLNAFAFVLAMGLMPLGAAWAQTPSAPHAAKGPELFPGEGLAIGMGERQAFYGASDQESPMGTLAELVWLRTEGEEWAARDHRYKCTGEMAGLRCGKREGHGKVDLAKAMQQGCDLAFLAWARWSMQRWDQESGEGSARVRLEEAFRSFLGRRMPKGDGPLTLDLEWVGAGQLLRTSPKAMLLWLMDPLNEGFNEQAMRFLRPVGGLFSKQGVDWWMKTGTMPSSAEPGAASAWVAGSDGMRYAVLYLPKSHGQAEDLARFKALMDIKK
jgi:hypothetical protein